MAITPTSEVRLLAVPLDKTQKHQIRFDSAGMRDSYFLGRPHRTVDNVTYTRKDRAIKLPAADWDDIGNYNYVMYKNDAHENRWIYAFIDKYEYVNDATIAVYIKTDVYQTWRLDLVKLPCFVVREHVSDDTIGKHLMPEGLELGDYTYKNLDFVDAIRPVSIVMEVAIGIGGYYNGVFHNSAMVVFGSSELSKMQTLLDDIDDAGIADVVVSIFMMPTALIPPRKSASFSLWPLVFYDVIDVDYPTSGEVIDINLIRNYGSLDGYTPKNNKLFAYPYNFLNISTPDGKSADYHYEYFDDSYEDCYFAIESDVGPNPTIFMTPMNYNGVEANYAESLRMQGYPICAWKYDVYKNWLAQNAASIPLSVAGGALSIVGSAAAGQPLGVAGGILAVAQTLGQVYEHAVIPPHMKGHQPTAAALAINALSFMLKPMCIRAEFAKRIDQYFSMYGYKVATVKEPEENSRPYWNYVQTIGMNFEGTIPADDLAELKAIYDNGITLWHSGAYVGNYALDNSL